MTYTITPHSDELCHYGVLGMKWGIRRYQNYDGTRIGSGGQPVVNRAKTADGSVKKLKGTMDKAFKNTVVSGQGGKAKGLSRLAATAGGPKPEVDKDKLKEHLTSPNVKQGKGKDNITPIEDAAKDVGKLTDSGKKLTELGKKYDPKVKEAGQKASREAKNMSDAELRERINRIKMEREYQSLKESEVSSGWDKAHEILDVAGTVVFIVGTLASLYLNYKLAKAASLKHSDIPMEEVELYNFMTENQFDDDVIQHFIDMDDEYVDDFLEHYGVLGMKWGVRRYQNYDGTRIGAGSGPVTRTGDRIARKKGERTRATKPFDKKINRLERQGADPDRIARKKAERDQVSRSFDKKISRLENKLESERKTTEDRISRKKAEKEQAVKPFDKKISKLEKNGADQDRIDRKKSERDQVAQSFDKKINKLVQKYENVKLDQLAASVANKPKDSKTLKNLYTDSKSAEKELVTLGKKLGQNMYDVEIKQNKSVYENSPRMKAEAKEFYDMEGFDEACRRRPDLVKKQAAFKDYFDEYSQGISLNEIDDEIVEYYYRRY